MVVVPAGHDPAVFHPVLQRPLQPPVAGPHPDRDLVALPGQAAIPEEHPALVVLAFQGYEMLVVLVVHLPASAKQDSGSALPDPSCDLLYRIGVQVVGDPPGPWTFRYAWKA